MWRVSIFLNIQPPNSPFYQRKIKMAMLPVKSSLHFGFLKV